MSVINANTKISSILKQSPEALEAIISISPKFNKLRNPLLRKLMASRTSISMASKIGGCTVDDFFEKLQPLGFEIDTATQQDGADQETPVPAFMKNVKPENTVELDVRPILDAGKDPLRTINEKAMELTPGQTLKLINSFDPIPLIQLLEKQGYESYSNIIDENTVYTYFFKTDKAKSKAKVEDTGEGWEESLKRFEGRMKTIDVRELEMPLPMLTILDELENLPADMALYVYHKRIPVFLLPELRERKFEFRTNEIGDGDVRLFIFKA